MDLHVFEQLLGFRVVVAFDLVFVEEVPLFALMSNDLKTVTVEGILALGSTDVCDFHLDWQNWPGVYLLGHGSTRCQRESVSGHSAA